MVLSNLFALCAALCSTLQVISATPTSTTKVLPPSKDPWYTAPSGYASAKPGDVLRFREAPGNLPAFFNESTAAYNLLFRTIDSHYNPSWAVTTLFVPKDSNGSSLLSYQIPYNSANVDGSPSYLLHSEFKEPGLVLNDINTALSYGWYVNVPDFEGPQASFPEIIQEGAAVLDSIRAVLQKRKGLQRDANYALWGYSGGSIASEAASELQASHAPELNISGIALGGTVPNATTVLFLANKSTFAGLIPEVLLGVTSQFPAVQQFVISQLKPEYKAKFLKAKQLNIAQAFTFYNNSDIWSYFKNGAAVARAPIFQELINQHSLLGYHGIPVPPLYIYKAIGDELSPVADTDALVERYCGVDVDILYERNTVGGHLAEETNGDARALAWLRQVLSGSYKPTGCITRNVTIGTDTSPL